VTVSEVASTEIKSPFKGPRADLGKRSRPADTVIIVSAIVAGLYFGRDVLVPIALAVLLSFVLAPVVIALGRLHLGKVASVLATVIVAFALLAGLGTVIGRQISQLAEDLPQYQSVIGKKLASIRSSDFGRGVVEKAADALRGLDAKIVKPAGPASTAAPAGSASQPPKQTLVPVEVHEPPLGPIQILQSILSALLPPLATAAIVIIFVIFILLQRNDLRDRFIGLIGAHDLHRTTTALDDAAFRLSRYFLALTGINALFGLLVGAGLMLIGVPNPVLWGIVGAVLRFVPYIGALISAAFPLALAAAVDPGWGMVLDTALLFIVLETAMGQFVEPQLFGHTTGMSPLAIIVAAAFWTLIWGAAGLLLSTPITACLVVLGRHVESLNFIELLLGDKPALSPVQSFYQRILASDPDEVAFQAEILLKDMSLLEYYEQVAMPALALAQADVSRGVLEQDRQVEVCSSVERVTGDLSDHVDALPDENELDAATDEAATPAVGVKEPAPRGFRSVLCLGGRTPLDQAACAILVQLLERENVATRLAGPDAVTSSGVSDLSGEGVDAICIVYLDHQSIAPLRFAVRRLRKKFPNMPIAICLWGAPDLAAKGDAVRADATLGSLHEAIEFCRSPEETPKSTDSTRALPGIRLVSR
jgi:predicted PurR-regulated permease PerM